MTVKYVMARSSASAKSAPRQRQVRPSLSFIHWIQPNWKAKQTALVRAKQYQSTHSHNFRINNKGENQSLSDYSLPYKDYRLQLWPTVAMASADSPSASP